MSIEYDLKTLAVVMACHNRREKTLSCLRAFNKQKVSCNLSIDVFLLDDGSTDGTSEAVRDEFPETRILNGDGRMFWNRGMRESFSAAMRVGFDYYLWLNDDSILYEGALEVLLNTHSMLKSTGYECSIIGSAMHDPTSHQFTYGGVKRLKKHWGWGKDLEKIAPLYEAIQCDATNGNCVLISASVVKKVGNLDEIYKHRWGDHDYCFRALQQGCSVWLAPGYLGTCESNPIEGTWEDTSLPLMERFKKLNSPHGFQFLDYAVYMRRHRSGPWWIGRLVWPYFKIVLQSIKS